MFIGSLLFNGTLLRRFFCILVKTAQIFDLVPFFLHETGLNEYHEREILRDFSEEELTIFTQFLATSPKCTERTLKILANFFKLQAISILAICKLKAINTGFD